MRHDPHHVAHLAAVLLSSRPEPEAHHIKAAVEAARALLDEAHRGDDEDMAPPAAAPEKPEPEAQGTETQQ